MSQKEDLMDAEEGMIDAPERIAVIGEGGLGKTTFASSAPRPYFIDVERGSLRFKHVARNPEPIGSWQAIVDTVERLRTKKHSYKTIVLDTLDRAEWYCWKSLCERDGVNTIDYASGGYGKGYNESYSRFRELFGSLERVREERQMHIIILAHPKVEKVRNPSGNDYDKFVFKVHSAVGQLMYEACDHVLFASRNIIVSNDAFDDDRHRAIAGDKRVLRTAGSPTYYAKTRVSIPDPIPLSWHDWVCHLASKGFTRLLRETVQDNARRTGDVDLIKKVEGVLASGASVTTLARANHKLLQMLGGAAAEASEEGKEDSPKEETPVSASVSASASTAAASPATPPAQPTQSEAAKN